MKTEAEIADLKHQWSIDPCWDIETTEGFEEHRYALYRWRMEIEGENERKEHERLSERAAKLGIHANHELVKFLESLEYKISKLEDRIDNLKYGD